MSPRESDMNDGNLSRRDALRTGLTSMAAGVTALAIPRALFPTVEEEEIVPFLDMPRTPEHRLDWESLDSWITPQDQVFNVQHYGIPEFDTKDFRLAVTGLVERPRVFTTAEIEALPKKDQLMTLECSGNGVNKGFMNAIYNGKWTGTPLAPILKACGLKPTAKEVVFFGKDRQDETLRKGTKREITVNVAFGRSMSVVDALNENCLLAYQRSGKPIEKRNGAPLRLIVPGWYGIANVKWLTRIHVRRSRYMGRYMGRDYVTVRGERRGDEVVYDEMSVTRMNLKSIVARVTRRPTANGLIPLRAFGAVWSDGTAIKRVEVKVDDGPWRPAKLVEKPIAKFCWRFFSIDLGNVKPSKHTVVSRAVDVNGRTQPSAEEDEIALKKTYWEAYQQWPREIEVTA